MFQLSIKDLRTWVSLGCGDEERFNKQPVSITIDIEFKEAPKAMQTDDLRDTICYAGIVETIEKLCQSRSFRLIEHLAAQIGTTISEQLREKASAIETITVSLSKMKVPVPNVHGAVSFTYMHKPEEKGV